MPKRSITLTLQEWKNLRYWLPNPDYVCLLYTSDAADE